MTHPIPFQFNRHQIRAVPKDGEPWFVTKDIAEALGYSDGTIKSMSRLVAHVPEQWRGLHPIQTPSGIQQMAVLSEAGMFFFLNRSDKPKALPFQMWLAGEVLPSIRKTGGYTAPAAQMPDTALCQTPEHYKTERARLEAELEKLAATPIALTPEQYNQLTGERVRVGKKDYLVSEMVNIFDHYGIPRKVAEEITGLNNNTIRQHALIGRRRKGGAK